jgi:TolA-binding protein
MLLLVVGCSSKKTDKELFDEAQKNLKENKIPEAVTTFDKIATEYSDSKLAPEALSQLAAIYQNKMDKSISEKENLEKSVSIFKKLHDEYPKSEYAPTGLFMAAFISANELNKYDEATALYKQFLQEYPENDLAASARAELDNMGKSPEDILRNSQPIEK